MLRLCRSFTGELVHVYDRGVSWFSALLGFEPGVIYIRFNASPELYAPGDTLLDTVRHGFAHVQACVSSRWPTGTT